MAATEIACSYPRLERIAARQQRALIADLLIWALVGTGLVLAVVAAVVAA